jgi:uncharacterized membrane protein (UPF0127 family)
MRFSVAVIFGVLGIGLALVLFGKSGVHQVGARPGAVQWQNVSFAGRVACLPVADSRVSVARGLVGVRRLFEPVVFVVGRDRPVSVRMRGVRVAVAGVWVGPVGNVFGYWHGRPGSRRVFRSRGPVSLVIEYAAGAKLPPVGSLVRLTGTPCAMGPGI